MRMVTPMNSNGSHATPRAEPAQALELTGERTAPGHKLENYWFVRHEIAYSWSLKQIQDHSASSDAPLVIVDAGCGEGYGANMLSAIPQSHVIGLELDDSAATHARATYGPRVEILNANLDQWPLMDSSADVVVTMQVVEHLWNLKAFFAECRRVLKPGGLLIVTTPNRLTFSPGLQRGETPTNPFHVEEFDMDQLSGLISKAQFNEIQERGVHHDGALLDWESANGSIVNAQIQAALDTQNHGSTWPDELVSVIEWVDTSCFSISSADLEHSVDLVVTAVRPLND